MSQFKPGFIEETIRISLVNILEDREYLGLQLALSLGDISREDFERESPRYLLKSEYPEEELRDRVSVLKRLIGDQTTAEVVSTAFRCSLESAEEALASLV